MPDYNELYDAFEQDRENELEKYPKCDLCDEPITDEYFYNIDGTFICEECLNSEYRIRVDDYIEEGEN
jgi:formylmethanofuran dehydrogenase subunit E